MSHFFILTHLGANIGPWNSILSTNKFLHSKFIYDNFNTYYNRNIQFDADNYEIKFSKFFDILVFNWQIGFKNALDFSKIIYLKNDSDEAVERIAKTSFVHNNYIKNYYDMRLDFIFSILKNHKDYMVLEDNFEDIDRKLHSIADFLQVPVNFKFKLS
jgi:hypothetical protein